MSAGLNMVDVAPSIDSSVIIDDQLSPSVDGSMMPIAEASGTSADDSGTEQANTDEARGEGSLDWDAFSTTATTAGADDDSDTEWRELPSYLHLEILQLLQTDADSYYMDNGSDSASHGDSYPSEEDLATAGITMEDFQNESDVTIGELFDALRAIREDPDRNPAEAETESAAGVETSSDIGKSSSLGWAEFSGALHWLYMHNLVHFNDPRAELSAQELFKGAEVLDLRSFTR